MNSERSTRQCASGQITSNFHFRENDAAMSIMVKMVIMVKVVIMVKMVLMVLMFLIVNHGCHGHHGHQGHDG